MRWLKIKRSFAKWEACNVDSDMSIWNMNGGGGITKDRLAHLRKKNWDFGEEVGILYNIGNIYISLSFPQCCIFKGYFTFAAINKKKGENILKSSQKERAWRTKMTKKLWGWIFYWQEEGS